MFWEHESRFRLPHSRQKTVPFGVTVSIPDFESGGKSSNLLGATNNIPFGVWSVQTQDCGSWEAGSNPVMGTKTTL